MSTITLSENYGYTSYKSSSSLAAGSTIDASAASWIVSNHGTQTDPYPVLIYNGGTGLTLLGGHINGTIDQTTDWRTVYDWGNSAAIRVETTPGVKILNWTIDKAWDGIRIAGGSNNFLIEDVHLSNVRDDAVENDYVLGGTIRDSLFDGVFNGISLGDSDHYDGSNNTVTLDGVLMRMKAYSYEGDNTHYAFFKADKDAPQTTPDIVIKNTVFAVEDPTHNGFERLQLAWDHVTESSNNVLLNLSDTPLPSNYPKPPAGFTILQGQAARDYWEAAKATWLDNHDGTPTTPSTGTTDPAIPSTETPTSPSTDPIPEPEPSVNTIEGTSRANTLKGTSGIDKISGYGGADKIFGFDGNDILSGGSGRDTFVLNTKLGTGNVDTITDFNVADDRFFLDNAVFTKLGSGSLSSPRALSKSYFEADGEADDSNDYILYDKASGALSYDADGSGSMAAVKFAQIASGLNLSAADFYIV